MKNIFSLVLMLALLINPVTSQAAFFSNQEAIVLKDSLNEDAFTAGNSVSINTPIGGEVFAFGSSVSIDKTPTRSIVAAGGSVTIDQGAGYNAYIFGNNVTLSGEFGHDVYVYSPNLTIKPGTVIKGDLRAAGGTLTLSGKVNGNAEVNAASLISELNVDGNYKIDSDKLSFIGGAIGKDLSYKSSSEAIGLDKIKVVGKTDKLQTNDSKPSANEIGLWLSVALVASWFYKLLSAMLVGALLILLVPKKLKDTLEIISTQWSRALAIGAIALVVAPFVAVFLLATIIGWPVGLAVILIYITWLLIAPVYGMFLAGRWILGRFGDSSPSNWAVLLVGTVAISILTSLPIIGWPAMLILFIVLTLPSLGAVLIWLRQKLV